MLDSWGRPKISTVGEDICLHLPGLIVPSSRRVAVPSPPSPGLIGLPCHMATGRIVSTLLVVPFRGLQSHCRPLPARVGLWPLLHGS